MHVCSSAGQGDYIDGEPQHTWALGVEVLLPLNPLLLKLLCERFDTICCLHGEKMGHTCNANVTSHR
jgi:hypothetical protein